MRYGHSLLLKNWERPIAAHVTQIWGACQCLFQFESEILKVVVCVSLFLLPVFKLAVAQGLGAFAPQLYEMAWLFQGAFVVAILSRDLAQPVGRSRTCIAHWRGQQLTCDTLG